MAGLLDGFPRCVNQQQQRWSDQLQDRSRSEQALTLLGENEKAHDEEIGESGTTLSNMYRHLRSAHLPSFRRPNPHPRKLHPTSYLDGLRGTAAFIVFLHHSTQAFVPSIKSGWASSPQSLNLLSLPVIRIYYSGGAMVSIFFVISGYVLSIRPLQLATKAVKEKNEMSQGKEQTSSPTDLSAAYANVASATFRRGPRLMIPCLVSTLLTAVLAMLGAFVEGANPGLQRHYPRAETWTAQLTMWWEHSLTFVQPFGGTHPFEENTWTIPAEFKGSLMVFLTVMGLAGRSRRMRRCCIWLQMGYWTWFGTWDSAQFLAGVGLAEWKASRDCDKEAKEVEEGNNRSTRTKVAHAVLVLIAVYLLSMPEGDENVANSPGYITLATTLTPEGWRSHWGPGRWWPTWGAILLIGTLDHTRADSMFQRVFTSKFAQFLGDISFSLYLLHGITIYSVGVRVMRLFTTIFGGEDPVGYIVSLGLSAAVVLPFLFWISDLFTEVVDKGAVNLARRIMKW
jgi:peptidoglycan/LPS O-acetylase OafA/YrhL